VLSVPLLEPEPKPNADISPGQATPRRIPATPSKIKHNHHAPRPSPTGMQFGTEVHALLERVTWIDEELPILPTNEAGNAVAALLKNPALLHLFERQNRSITLFREQCVDAVINDKFLTGVIDRLLIHRSPDNSVTRVEIIDFKTDTLNDPAELIDRYATQMAAYQSTLKKIHPAAEINGSLLSVHLGVLVPVDA
jgi:ATP-dependent exoDNAse (exonuclease V) beta subunit